MKSLKFNRSILSVSIAVAITGCASVNVDEVRKKAEKDFDDINNTYKQGQKFAPETSSISYMDGFYIAEKPYKMEDREILPSFFHEEVSYSKQEPTSFQRLTSLISERIGIRISYSDDASEYLDNWVSEASGDAEEEVSTFPSESALDPMSTTLIPELPGESGGSEPESEAPNSVLDLMGNDYGNLPGSGVLFTIEHSGTLSELMDNLTGRVGLYWKWQDNEINIFRTENKNIPVDIDAIAQKFSSTMTSSSEFVQGNASGGSGSSGNGMKTEFSIEGGKPYDRLLSVIENTMLSDQGSVEVFEDFKIVSITDIPPNVKRATEFLEEINDIATRQVAVKVDVITVTSRNKSSAGFDWDAFYDGISGLNAEFTGSIFEGAGNLQVGIIDSESAFNGTTGFVKAIAQYADVSTHYSGFAQTTNGKMVPITDNIKEDYLKKISVEKGGEDEGDTVTTEIGEAKTGIDMTIIPHITSKDEVSLNIKYDLNELISMKSESAGDSTVMLPTSSIKGSYIKTIIESGKTYMVAGTSNKKSQSDTSSIAGDDSPFSWIFGGRKESTDQEEYSILMITPYIMNN